MTMSKVYEPIEPPVALYSEDPRAHLTDGEQLMYDAVLQHFSKDDYLIPGLENGALTEAEKFFLSYECLLRYLRATKWKSSEAAIGRLEATLVWRREYGIYDTVTDEHVEPESVTGKQILFGYDVDGRPAIYLFPSRQNTEEPTRQIQFSIWTLERALDLMGPGVETIAVLINYGDKGKNPPLSVARTWLSILQNHYPERLGRSLILNVPFILNAFYKLINPFIDPVVRAKMRFNPRVVEDSLFTADMIMKEWWEGGCDFEYVHERFWPVMLELCEKRRKAWMDKWRAMGGKVGLKEWDYKRGNNDEEKHNIEKPEVILEISLGNGGQVSNQVETAT